MAITLPTVLRNPEVFPSPENFIPERWLGESGKELEKWNVAFSKGSRQCLGMRYVYIETADPSYLTQTEELMIFVPLTQSCISRNGPHSRDVLHALLDGAL